MSQIIYFDNSATTRPYDEVMEYMGETARNLYGNPSSLHRMGMAGEKEIKKWREGIAKSLSVEAREIIFTSGGTESNNMAIKGYLEANPRKGKHIITTKVEHPSVLEVFKDLSQKGYRVDFIGVDTQGVIDLDGLRKAISADTALISLILVNNELGSMLPVEEVARIRDSINRDAVIHLDGVQAYGKIQIHPKKWGVGLLSMSSHKLHGPKGVGALFCDRKHRIKPLMLGGGQEALMRSGTENTPGIAGFGLASQLTFERLESNRQKVEALKDLFHSKLIEVFPQAKINSPSHGSPYILNMSFPGLRSEVLLHHLEMKGIFVSTGSACSSRKNLHSHVLTAAGLTVPEIEGAIRFSFSSMNTPDEVNVVLEELIAILPQLGGKKWTMVGR